MSSFITYKIAQDLFQYARTLTVQSIQHRIGDRQIALNDTMVFTEAKDENLTVDYYVRRITKDGIQTFDPLMGETDERPWKDVPDYIALHILRNIVRRHFHKFREDED